MCVNLNNLFQQHIKIFNIEVQQKAVFFILALIFLSSCQLKEEWRFVGETKNWRVVYEMEKREQASKLTIEYIREKPIPKEIGYRVNESTEIGTLDEHGVLTVKDDGCEGCHKLNEIPAAIEWGRQINLFTLHLEE